MSEPDQLSCPGVRAGASFNADQACWRGSKELQYLLLRDKVFFIFTLPWPSTPWTWKTDFAISRPIRAITMFAPLSVAMPTRRAIPSVPSAQGGGSS
jgi:hypothetical protein